MHDEVVVVAHEALRQRLGLETVYRRADHLPLRCPVGVVTVDGFAAVTAKGDVAGGAGEFEAKDKTRPRAACHRSVTAEPGR